MSEHSVIIIAQLRRIEDIMQSIDLWQFAPPEPQAFESDSPFYMDTMAAGEWLQWVFIPRIRALIEANVELPTNFTMLPYFEEALKEHHVDIGQLFEAIKRMEMLLNHSGG